MPQRDPMVRLLHMRDYARKAVDMASGRERTHLDKDEMFQLALTPTHHTPLNHSRLVFHDNLRAPPGHSYWPPTQEKKMVLYPPSSQIFSEATECMECSEVSVCSVANCLS